MTDLSAAIRGCQLCPHIRAKQDVIHNTERLAEPVPGYAGKRYRHGGIAVVFDSPSYYASQRGRPVPAGKDGNTFTELVLMAGMEREELLLMYTVRCRPPGNRIKDYPEAVFACGNWTAAEMSAYAPSVVVLMGAAAIQTVYGNEAKVGATRGTLRGLPSKHTWGQRACVCTYNPKAAEFAGGIDSEYGQFIIADLRVAKQALEVLS